MKNFFFLILGFIVILGSLFIFFTRTPEIHRQTKFIKLNDTSIEVEVADTPKARVQGLSGRESLLENRGMFFVFEKPALYEFWMKDMNFPIDIVWVDENFHVIGVEQNILPETYPEKFRPNQAVKYVVELPAGYTEAYNINAGAVVLY